VLELVSRQTRVHDAVEVVPLAVAAQEVAEGPPGDRIVDPLKKIELQGVKRLARRVDE
jgi:hypothetical protein